ncbi:porin family protein [Sphingobacterium sp. SRCM116780]|uniref:outer membrane beta-barrel protein n=1 Tax=Sphingobacterium sp. SRCM116780 TaxID=2907623 RepID=UPI001F1877C7|nr:OmpW family outer membrane protein [Sphingobacterium sp. SRCM116780]UIR57241.1 porin family protein [Sphingobacterium sp. SRCM116780]
MKKLLLTLTAVAGLTFASNAQEFGFKKTDFIIEGNLSANTSDDKGDKEKTSTFNFNPSVGYFVSDKFAVGLDFNFGNHKETDYSGSEDTYAKSNKFGVGAYGRYYFLELGSRFKTYAQLAAGYNQTTGEINNGTTTVDIPKSKGFGAGAGLGVNYFVTSNIAINFGLTDLLSYHSEKPEGGKSQNTFNANINSFNNFFDTAKFGLTFKF